MALRSFIMASAITAASFGVCSAEAPIRPPKAETIISTAANASTMDRLLRQPLESYRDNMRVGHRRLRTNPNDAEGHNIVGMSYFYIWLHYSHDQQDLDGAMAALRRGAAADSNGSYSNVALSKVLCTLGRHEDELKELDEAIGRQPADHALYGYRAETLRELGREEDAKADEKTAAKLKAERSSDAN